MALIINSDNASLDEAGQSTVTPVEPGTSEAGQGFSAGERESAIVRTSLVGIVANIFLAGFKAAVGLISNSIAIILDAVNNLSDAASSVITIIGTKLAGKEPDYKHPYGHGRIEYLTTIVIAVIVLWAGVQSLIESVQRIINPEIPSYEVPSLIIIAAAVVVKIVLGRYVKRQGERLGAASLVASGTDATMDAIISFSTLVAALIFIFTQVSLEAWLGAIISLVIIKAGIDILREAIGKILGERVDPELTQNIKQTINAIDGVHGAYDLVLNDYGPNSLTGSIHIAVDDTCTALDIDKLTRKIQTEVYYKHQVILHTVGIYPTNTQSEELRAIEQEVTELVWSHQHILEVHGFFLDEKTMEAYFDVIISFDAPDRMGLYNTIVDEVKTRYPQYKWRITLDSDISD
ncbi:MAG: cation transporter [Coriobacteriales bacterium]|nr:cation transporter [Coriobacteriales bacterium]